MKVSWHLNLTDKYRSVFLLLLILILIYYYFSPRSEFLAVSVLRMVSQDCIRIHSETCRRLFGPPVVFIRWRNSCAPHAGCKELDRCSLGWPGGGGLANESLRPTISMCDAWLSTVTAFHCGVALSGCSSCQICGQFFLVGGAQQKCSTSDCVTESSIRKRTWKLLPD